MSATAAQSALVQRFTGLLKNVRPDTNGWNAQCPAHDDSQNSLRVAEGEDGRVLVKCHAGCTAEAITAAVGLKAADLFPGTKAAPFGKIVATYDYCDESGALLFQVVRDEHKNFRQRRRIVGRDPNEPEWAYNLDGARRVLYRLPEVLAAVVAQVEGKLPQPIFIVEGEKDADNLAKLGLVATTAPMGAGAPWLDSYSEQIKGAKNVVILPDNDKAGREHAAKVAASLHGKVEVTRILTLPGLAEKGDVSDWIAAEGTKEKLEALIQRTPRYSHPTERFISIDVGMNTFMAIAIEPPIAILDGIFGGYEVSLLVGKPGAGKSFVVLELAHSLVRGKPFYGHATPEGGVAVGVVMLEGHEYHWQKRLQALAKFKGSEQEGDERLRFITRPRLQGRVMVMDPETIPGIVHWVVSRDLKVVIFDPLKNLHDCTENDNDEMGAVMAQFQSIADQTGAHVLVTHHESSKATEGNKRRDAMAASRGASRLMDDAKCVMHLVRESSGLRVLAFGKVSFGGEPDAVWLLQDKATGFFAVTESPHEVANRNRERVHQALLKLGADGVAVKRAAIDAETGLSESVVKTHLVALEKGGKAWRGGSGPATKWYSTPPPSATGELGI